MAARRFEYGNQLGEFASESAALETVRIITDADPSEIDALVLLSQDALGQVRERAAGQGLAQLLGRSARVRLSRAV
jgi:hypothetical protein